MPYDALGNYVPGDEPSIDQMQYELTKRGRRVDDPRRIDKPTSLDSAVNTIKDVATTYNPLSRQNIGTAIKKGFEAREAVKDVGRIGASFSPAGIIPIWQAVVDAGLTNVNKQGAEALYRLAGDEDNAARVANERAQLPGVNKLIEKYSEPLQARTPGGQAVQQGVTKFLFDDLKLPPVPIGPRGSGFAASGQRRPLLTPDDTRALMGEANRVATQVRDIPVDFQNAQSGFRRLDPITNKPTFGTKLQSAADSLGETMERRKMQGLNPVPGVPDVFMPETQMYAVRPGGGSYMVNPKLPESAMVERPSLSAGAYDIINDLRPVRTESPVNLHETYFEKYVRENNAIAPAYANYLGAKLQEMYPETTSKREAAAAFESTYPDENQRAEVKSQILSDFINQHNTAQPDAKLPTLAEFNERVQAVNNWLEGPFYKQMYKNVGTSTDPLLKLAEQGYTLEEAGKLIKDWPKPDSSTRRYRELAGFHPMGEYYEPLQQITQQIAAKEREYLPLEQRRMELQNIAADQGLQDPAQLPEYAAITTPRDRLSAEIAKLKEKQYNLQLANAYENATDSLVNTQTAAEAYENIPRSQRHFFPQLRDLASSSPDTKVYDISTRQAGNVGYYEMANEYIDKVMSGEIPVSKIHKTPLDVFVKKLSKERQDKAKAAQAAIDQRISDVQAKLKEDLALAPEGLRFSKSTAIEVSNRFQPEEVRRILSADTEVLDHCISQCGSPEHGARNIFQPQDKTPRTYLPIADPITGVKVRPDVQDTSYIRNIMTGNQFHTSMRDNETGLPFITMQFSDAGYSTTGQPLFDMGFASGYQNKGADPKYRDDIAKYLNARADIIRNSNTEKLQEARVYDMNSVRNAFFNDINVSKKEWEKAVQSYNDFIPRFLTPEDGRRIVDQARAASTALVPVDGQTPETQMLITQRDRLVAERTELEAESRRRGQGWYDNDIDGRLDDISSQLDDINRRLQRIRAGVTTEQTAPVVATGNIYNYGDAYNIAFDQDRRGDRMHPMARDAINEAFREVAHTLPGVDRALNPFAPELQMAMLSRDDIDNAIELIGMTRSVIDTFDDVELAQERLTSMQQQQIVDQLDDAIMRLMTLLPAREFAAQPVALPALEQIRTIVDTTLRRENDPEVDRRLVAISTRLSELAAERVQEGQNPFEIADFIRDKLNRHRNDVLNNNLDPEIQFPMMTAQQIGDYVGALRSAIDSIGNFLVVNRPPAQVPAVVPVQVPWRQQIVNAYTNAFTERTGNIAVDDFLVRIEDALNDSVIEQINAGDRAPNDIAMSLANTISELQGNITSRTNWAMDAYNLAPADVRIADRRLNDALENVLGLVDIQEGFDQMPALANRQAPVPAPVEPPRAIGMVDTQAQLTSLLEDAINMDETAGSMIEETFQNHFDENAEDPYDILDHIAFELEGRVDYLRDLTPDELEGYGVESIDVLEQTTFPVMIRTANQIRAMMDRIPNGQPTVRRLPEPVQQPQLPAPIVREPAQQARLPDIAEFVENARRTEGLQVGERIETVLYRISENLNGIRQNPQQFMRQVRDAAELEENELVELGLNEFASQIEQSLYINQMAAPPAEVVVPPALLAPIADQGIPANPMPNEEFEQQVTDLFDNAQDDIGGDAEYILDHYFRDDQGPQIMRIDALMDAIDEYLSNVDPDRGGEVPLRFEGEGDPAFQLYLTAFDRLIRRLSDLQTDLQELRTEQIARASYNILQQVLTQPERDQVNDMNTIIQRAMIARNEDPNDYADAIRSGEFGGNDLPTVRGLNDIQREVLLRDLIDAHEHMNRGLGFEPDDQHPANMLFTYTFQDVQAMARDLFEAERVDGGRVDVRSVEDSIYALSEGMFDDERLRRYEPATRERLERSLAEALQTLLDQEPPQRRGPFQPGGSSAVRGMPLGNLNIRPSITAQSLRGPDSQPVSNFLQQVRGLPGVTQEGLATGLMAFENMDPNRRMTKAQFVRELLPSSYDIVSLQGTAEDNTHYRDMAETHVSEDPESVLDQMGISDRYHGEILEVLDDQMSFEDLSSGAKKALRKKNITDYDSLYASHAEAFKTAVEVGMEYLADMDGTQLSDENGYAYASTQRLVLDSMGDEYGEFGVTHPDQQQTYHHFSNAPKELIGHIRGTYNMDGLEVKTSDLDIFTTKPGSYVIEEIQSDAQKNSQQVAHLHQVHGVLFKAAIQKALESGADTVYLPTAKMIASERPGTGGHEPVRDERTGLVTMVPKTKDTTSKFKPIYDQAIVKEGLKPLLKIPGVTSKLVSNGDYHEITFTPEAKEHILNGPGQTVPGYKKGGRVQQFPSIDQMQYELMMRRA